MQTILLQVSENQIIALEQKDNRFVVAATPPMEYLRMAEWLMIASVLCEIKADELEIEAEQKRREHLKVVK